MAKTASARQADAPLVWLLLGQKTGDNNQVLSLADALDWPYTDKHIVNRPWELLSNRCLPTSLAGIDRRHSSSLEPPWPDLVISAGRRNEPVARWIRKQSGSKTRLVHIGRPWAPLASWDLIVTTPQYFLPERDNILHNQLPLHRITAQRLQAEWQRIEWPWRDMRPPLTAVMLGGDSGPFVFTPEKACRMGQLVNNMVSANGGSVLVTDSRRTPEQASAAFLSQLQVPVYRHSWRQGGENPYLAYLASADQLVVTGESMSMLAEASATGKPLYIFDLSDKDKPWWQYRHGYRFKPLSHHLAMRFGPRRMHRDISMIQGSLVAAGRAGWLEDWRGEGSLAERPHSAEGTAQQEAAAAAARIRALFGR